MGSKLRRRPRTFILMRMQRGQGLRGRLGSLVSTTIVAIALTLGVDATASAAEPWLFVNDVHLNPSSTDAFPASLGNDPNPALLASALNEMRHVAPHPPVIVMAGDFLGHAFKAANAIPTMILLARRFNGVFPHAQFVMALGNEDSDCGDYSVTPNSKFLRAVAHAWEPLVNRNGAAPTFMQTFPQDGFYTARLPVKNLEAVVLDNAFWSPFYRNLCGPHGDPTPQTLSELETALPTGTGQHRWLVMHIPPGIDVSSTRDRAHHLAIVPFMRPDPRDRLLQLVADPARHVDLVATGHVHRFSYRIIGSESAPVPVLVAPAVSPIYYNNPSFLTADVQSDGRIRNLEEYSRVGHTWRDVGGLSMLGASEFSGTALVNLQHRLSRDGALRATFSRLYTGGTRWRDIDEGNWRSYWCVATDFSATAYRDCLDEGGFSFLTRRGVVVVGVAATGVIVVAAGAVALIVMAVRRRRRAPRAD